ncbi:hypothetical protein JAAARDRAFT_193167 [Jaapia argillacea MUCL 33604]|uniref:G-protein coupled receptors family 1 profile domain-containing protein n=1 Tax=Jaapia argillacea MUCL 33604 TaxID=933084 RepID=A0A067Q7N7_9AGAM|nr:hypothetical protein JAAARDRAFT_193167 [Jaapia argillacea MUCL 33604]
MVDWQSPAEIKADSVAFANVMHALLDGNFVHRCRLTWTTLEAERHFIGHWYFRFSFLRTQETDVPSKIFYFANRYLMLFTLVGITVSLNVTAPINCQALYTFNQFCGTATIGLASINLSIRTMFLWLQKWYIVGPLVVIIIGHWSILLHGVLVEAAYFPGQGCVITKASGPIIAAAFVYAMVFDFIVLLLTGIRLAFPVGGSSMHRRKSRLTNLIFTDGLIYFFIAFLANLITTTFILLDLNPIMSVITNVPAAMASTIVATRVVRRLRDFSSQNGEAFLSTQMSPSGARIDVPPQPVATMVFVSQHSDSVHIPLETFSRTGHADESLDGDAAERGLKMNQYDPESRINKPHVEPNI